MAPTTVAPTTVAPTTVAPTTVAPAHIPASPPHRLISSAQGWRHVDDDFGARPIVRYEPLQATTPAH
jgi:hypothetical protein